MNVQNALDFLNQLKNNNNKEWFHANKAWYNQIKKTWETFINELITEISGFDPALTNLDARQCTFRINRDIRFSKDKSPYKTNLGAFMSKSGRKSIYAGYYIHLEPEGQSFLAGGVYMPESSALKKIRDEIDYNPDEFKLLVNQQDFKNKFGALSGEKLKTSPRGYSNDHPAIEYLRHKSFLMMHHPDQKVFNSSDFKAYALDVFQSMKPVNDFFNRALEEVAV